MVIIANNQYSNVLTKQGGKHTTIQHKTADMTLNSPISGVTVKNRAEI